MLSPSTIKQATFKALEHSCLKARLFYNFLRLSTSYAAGCVNKSKPLGLKLNAHGNKVRQAVDLYCNVHQMHFSNWLALPAVQNKFINHPCPIELIKGSDLSHINQSDIFIRFPNGLNTFTQRELSCFIRNFIPCNPARIDPFKWTPAVEKNLWKDIYLSYLLYNYPDLELWRIGAEAMLVDRLVGKVDPLGPRMNKAQAWERRHLGLTVDAHKKWAFNVSEQAAVDQFPCKEPMTAKQGSFNFRDDQHARLLLMGAADEMANARKQIIICSGSTLKVSVEPTLRKQGLLF